MTEQELKARIAEIVKNVARENPATTTTNSGAQ
jgi:hypothetical protein